MKPPKRPPIARQPPALLDDGSAPKRDRRRTLTRIDKRLPLGKRVVALKALYESMFSAAELTPLRREQIAEAAQLKDLAEIERGGWLRGEGRCNLDELVRLERRAASAVKGLGIVEKTRAKPPTLLARFAAKAAARP